MTITELSAATGVPTATIKYYVRERLLPAGDRISDNRTSYGDEHARRIRLVRALVEVGRIPVARAREVLAALDDDGSTVQDVFAVAQDALTPGGAGWAAADTATTGSPGSPGSPDDTGPPVDSLARVDAATATAGWCVLEGNAGRAQAARALDAFERSGHRMDDDYVAAYARAAGIQADADLDAVGRQSDRTAMAELMVVGTVLGDALAAGLRRVAQATVSMRAAS